MRDDSVHLVARFGDEATDSATVMKPNMPTRELSPREEEIVGLCVGGLTNDAIATQLGLSVGTVNTYWLRIRLKVGGTGRTDTVARIIKDRAERALRDSNNERQDLSNIIAAQEQGLVDLRAALALLHLAMDQIKSTVWATDRDLLIHIIANGEFPSTHCGVVWEVGKTVYEIFKTRDKKNPAVAAHLAALDGDESNPRLTGEFDNMILRVLPLRDEAGAVMGCISILNSVGES
ncbi:MAG: helix-turn-helix transcriptional regulator [Fimbriimonadaceae bacterium]